MPKLKNNIAIEDKAPRILDKKEIETNIFFKYI